MVVGNSATDGNGGGLSFGAGGTVINSTFYKNTATERGGGVYVTYDGDGDNPFNLRNSILVDNTATTAGNAIYFVDSGAPRRATDIEAVMDHNLIGGGEADLGIALFDRTANTYTTVALATATNVMLTNTVEESDATMVFASTDAANANFLRLVDGSPAVGAGDNDYVNNAVPPIATDAAGNTRIQSGTVDLGAYEGGIVALVAPTAQTLTFTDPTGGATVRVGQSIDLVATTDAPSDAMLAITFTSSATGIAVVENDGDGTFSLRLDGTGDVTITATQAGGTGANGVTYARATATQTITVEAAALVASNIRRVTTTGTGDGSSWTQPMTLQAALAASTMAGDQVWIAAGTYKPDATDRTATFTIPAGVLVYGGFDPIADASDADASSRSGGATILSGDLADNDASRTRTDNSRTVVTIGGADVTLDGLTIEAGEGEISSNGGGLFAGAGTTGITLTACTFNNNSADDQGGGAYFMESATLTDCTFNNNSVNDDGGGAFFRAAPTLTNCVFTDNNAIDDGGGAYFLQAATLTGCDFNDNNSDYWGGGAFFSGTATVTNCTFTANTANGGPSEGGGAYFNRTGIVTQCTFTDNETTNNGGGAYFDGVSTVINSTLYNNSADDEGGGLYVTSFGFPFTLQNSILVGNTAADAASGHQTYVNNTAADEVNVQNNLFAGATGIVYDDDASANITEVNTIEESDVAVVFASTTATNENYLRLATGSPAVNAGNNLYLNNGTPGNTDDDIKTDLAGETRIQGGTVDLGAYEGAVAPVAPTAQTIIRRVTTTGTGDGSSWTQPMTLQAALMASTTAGDQVWIAAGRYKPGEADDGDDATDEREATFTIPAGVLVYGGFDPVADASDTDASSRSGGATILSGDLSDNDLTDRENVNYTLFRNDNSYSVVTVGGADVMLDGLTIEGGERGTAVTTFGTNYHGAGLYAGTGTTGATLTACIFNNNGADDSGGGAYFTESVTLTDCTFNNNSVNDDGGGAFFDGTTATLTNCVFTDNNAVDDGGGAYFDQAATLTGCDFNDNNSDYWGGGALFRGTATVTNCTFAENTANGFRSEGGGAIFFRTATVTQCTFTDNETTNDGGGATFRVAGTVINSTFYNNMADGQGGGIFASFGVNNPFYLQNSILLGNTAADVASGHQTYVNNTSTFHVVNIQHNLIAGGADPLGADQGVVYVTPGSANVTESGTVDESDATVVFASTDAVNANYLRLRAGSPAVNAGNNLYLNNGTPGNTADDIKKDAAGNARIQNRRVDLGAYESTLDAPATQSIVFADPTGGANVRVVGETLDLVATTNAPGLFVTFTTDPPGIATLLDDGTGDGMGRLRFDAVGVVTVTAVQAGGDSGGVTYPPATPVTHTIMVRPAGVAIFRVTTTGAGNRSGSSWANAMTLETALAISTEAGDQVWIAAGIYKPHADDRAATFTIPADVLVYGGFDPVADATDTDASSRSGAATILSGDLASNDDPNDSDTRNDNSYTVVTIGGANVTLDGLTIEGG